MARPNPAGPGGPGPAERGGRRKEGTSSDDTPARRFRSGRIVRLLLIGATITLAGALGTSSIRTWVDQREQLDGADREAIELDARIVSLEAEIATRTSEEAARIEALCFGPYVEPGVEVYSVPGVDGAASAAVDDRGLGSPVVGAQEEDMCR